MNIAMTHQSLANTVHAQGYLDQNAASLKALKAALSHSESPTVGDREAGALYLRSLQTRDQVVYAMGRNGEARFFCAFAWPEAGAAAVTAMGLLETGEGAQWSRVDVGGGSMMRVVTCPLTVSNAHALMEVFPFCRPVSLRERTTTVGTGDRLGLATPGHLRAARAYAVAPVLAQQSVRENSFTGRNFEIVVADAAWGVFQEGYEDGYGADGDHIKTLEHIDKALDAHMPMITLDLTEVMRPEVASWDAAKITAAFEKEFSVAERDRLRAAYSDRTYRITMGDGGIESVHISDADMRLCAVMYGAALDYSKKVNDHMRERTGGAYDLEISIDETTTPTLPAHHLFIAGELEHRNVTVNSLAPRFVGEFQKAIDYIGDLAEFERQFRVHCAIARQFGGYKISVHSGSDKFAVYPAVGRHTEFRLHLKTAGTSWLEALRVLARIEPVLYRQIHQFAMDYYPTALTHYHITADFKAIPSLASVKDAQLVDYLEDPNCRQMLHISYGGILNDPTLRPLFFGAMHRHEEAYAAQIEHHFLRHISLLGVARS